MASEPSNKFTKFQELMRRASITRDVRFRLSRRLETRDKFSYFVIAGHSLFIIILSLVPNIYLLSEPGRQALLALSIVNSIFVIVTTFWDASGDFSHHAQQLHKCATKISNLCIKLSLLEERDQMDTDKIAELHIEYQNALDDYPFTHSNMDYDLTKVIEPGSFHDQVDHGRLNWLKVRWAWLIYGAKAWCWLTPHAIILVATTGVLYLIVFDHYFGITKLVGS